MSHLNREMSSNILCFGSLLILRTNQNIVWTLNATWKRRNKSKGCFRNVGPFLTNLVFIINLSDVPFKERNVLEVSVLSFTSKIWNITQLQTQFYHLSGGLGGFVNRKIRLSNSLFWLKVSDLPFRSYKALNLAKNHYIFFSPLSHFGSKSSFASIASDAAEKL